MRFASLLSGGYITAIVVNPQVRKLAKRTSLHWTEEKKRDKSSKFRKKNLFLAKFLLFFYFFLDNQVLILSQDRGVCPGFFNPALVPGQNDTGTRIYFCPRTKGQREKETILSQYKGTRGRPVP